MIILASIRLFRKPGVHILTCLALLLSYTFQYYILSSLFFFFYNKAKRIMAQKIFSFRLSAPCRTQATAVPMQSSAVCGSPAAARRCGGGAGAACRWRCAAGNGPRPRRGIASRFSARTALRPILEASCAFLQISLFRAVKVGEVSSVTSHVIA